MRIASIALQFLNSSFSVRIFSWYSFSVLPLPMNRNLFTEPYSISKSSVRKLSRISYASISISNFEADHTWKEFYFIIPLN